MFAARLTARVGGSSKNSAHEEQPPPRVAAARVGALCARTHAHSAVRPRLAAAPPAHTALLTRERSRQLYHQYPYIHFAHLSGCCVSRIDRNQGEMDGPRLVVKWSRKRRLRRKIRRACVYVDDCNPAYSVIFYHIFGSQANGNWSRQEGMPASRRRCAARGSLRARACCCELPTKTSAPHLCSGPLGPFPPQKLLKRDQGVTKWSASRRPRRIGGAQNVFFFASALLPAHACIARVGGAEKDKEPIAK